MNNCCFNTEPFCFDVCGDHWRPQTLAEICRNGICCGFRAVAARDKYQGFILLKCFNFHWHFTEVCSSGTNWQLLIIGSGNGLALNRWQAITWTSDDYVLWHPIGHFEKCLLIKNNKFEVTPWNNAAFVSWALRNRLHCMFNQNDESSFQENAFENSMCEILPCKNVSLFKCYHLSDIMSWKHALTIAWNSSGYYGSYSVLAAYN